MGLCTLIQVGGKSKMAKTLITQITDCIEYIFDTWERKKKIIIYPCGDVGIQVFSIMKNIYSVEPAYLIDNGKCKYCPNIHELLFLRNIDTENYVLFLSSTNSDVYETLKTNALEYFPADRIVELESMLNKTETIVPKYKTKIGKYSYGPICIEHHPWIKSIGSFCSFADGVDFVTNHEMRYITTHPIIYNGKNIEGFEFPFEHHIAQNYYMPGIEPRPEKIKKQKRATIGNDVWLGRNVIVTNSANIGNGVIAAAGAIITKDVPDYAIVAGVPARIIKYRYTPEQIEALNEIAWWNWSDDEIRERFDDFYLPIEKFIKKYK